MTSLCAFAEPTKESPFYDGDSITLLQNGKTICSYTFGKNASDDEEFEAIYASLGGIRWYVFKKSWSELLEQASAQTTLENTSFKVSDKHFTITRKGECTYIKCNHLPSYTLKVTVSFTSLCDFH